MGMQLDPMILALWAVLAGTGITMAILSKNFEVSVIGGAFGFLSVAIFFWKISLIVSIIGALVGLLLYFSGEFHNFLARRGMLR